MIFLSGFAGLVYQVLWMRQLGLLFGNTAHAAAITLAVFFAGLATGGWFWGRRVSRSPNPLRLYAWLEGGIAVTALLYFGVIGFFHLIYPAVYQSTNSGLLQGLFKCVLALALVFPPALFMGGTIPAMGQCMITKRELFGTTTARIYGINTIGAALGALVAAFVAAPFLGFNKTCVVAMIITGCVATVAYWLAAHLGAQPMPGLSAGSAANAKETTHKTAALRGSAKKKGQETAPPAAPNIGRPAIFVLAFMSGFSVLALEVLWTRMFAQIHENSVYSFAAILVIVLVCLSLGALLAAVLAGKKLSPRSVLAVLLLASGGVLAVSPQVFMKLTHNLSMIPTDGTFLQYLGSLFGLGFATVGPACLLLGMVFPFLMKTEQAFARQAGESIGYISAINTLGAIFGSLICGFFLLRFVGMWETVRMIAVVYLGISILLSVRVQAGRWGVRVASGLLLLLLFTALNPSNLRVVGADPRRGKQTILRVWESSDCTVSAEEDIAGNKMIKINSNYILGSTGAIEGQHLQSRIPLFMHPNTESLFFLGMGTGVTAGGALDTKRFSSLKQIDVCEMVPEVVEAAKLYIAGGTKDYTNGLFQDPRVHFLIEDGRHYLMATNATYDMINADLFLPYRSGAGSLYSREHFIEAKARLNPGGVLVQWLPLYQLTDFEFGTINRTVLSVFDQETDQVTLWRNTFQPGAEVVALVAQKGQAPLPPSDLSIEQAKQDAIFGKRWPNWPDLGKLCNWQSVTLFYCGNVTASKHLFDSYPINTDDKPVIEYQSPLSLRQKSGLDFTPKFVGPKLADLVDTLLTNCPPDQDPVLVNRTAENRRLPLAGAALHRAWTEFEWRHPDQSKEAWDRFVKEWTNQ